MFYGVVLGLVIWFFDPIFDFLKIILIAVGACLGIWFAWSCLEFAVRVFFRGFLIVLGYAKQQEFVGLIAFAAAWVFLFPVMIGATILVGLFNREGIEFFRGLSRLFEAVGLEKVSFAFRPKLKGEALPWSGVQSYGRLTSGETFGLQTPGWFLTNLTGDDLKPFFDQSDTFARLKGDSTMMVQRIQYFYLRNRKWPEPKNFLMIGRFVGVDSIKEFDPEDWKKLMEEFYLAEKLGGQLAVPISKCREINPTHNDFNSVLLTEIHSHDLLSNSDPHFFKSYDLRLPKQSGQVTYSLQLNCEGEGALRFFEVELETLYNSFKPNSANL